MPITIEVNLRIPNVNVPAGDLPARRITNSDTRFLKVIHVPVLPKVGEDLELSTRAGVFYAVVKRLDWHEQDDRFVVACQYARKSMSYEQYESLRADPDWTERPLLR